MVICGSFQGEDDDSVCVLIRRFDGEEHREKLYAALYESHSWKSDMSARVCKLTYNEAIDVQRLNATRMSILQ